MNRLLLTIAFIVNAKLSWYDPSTCHVNPINCFNPAHWWTLSSGYDARHWYGKALACPMEFKIGTRFIIDNSRWGLADGEWICLDRGGMVIIKDDGTVILDLLLNKPIWADKLQVKVITQINKTNYGCNIAKIGCE